MDFGKGLSRFWAKIQARVWAGFRQRFGQGLDKSLSMSDKGLVEASSGKCSGNGPGRVWAWVWEDAEFCMGLGGFGQGTSKVLSRNLGARCKWNEGYKMFLCDVFKCGIFDGCMNFDTSELHYFLCCFLLILSQGLKGLWRSLLDQGLLSRITRNANLHVCMFEAFIAISQHSCHSSVM